MPTTRVTHQLPPEDAVQRRILVVNDVREVGRTVRILRRNARLTQSALARRIGLSTRFVSDLETNKKSPSTENFMAIARAFGYQICLLPANLALKMGSVKARTAALLADLEALERDLGPEDGRDTH
jgi:transcriptional regulator with XRE-family HTH domain